VNHGRHIKHSLSARLLWLYIIMSVLFVVLVGGIIRTGFKHNFQESIRPHLIQYLEYVQADIGSPPDKQKAKRIAEKLSIGIVIQDGQQTWSSNASSIDIKDIDLHREFAENDIIYQTGELNGREYLVIKQPHYTMAFSVKIPERGFTSSHAISILLLIVLLVGFYRATKRIFRPIATIEQGIRRIGNGDLAHRIEVNRQDELGMLATSINTMAQEIQRMLEAKRQLLLAISHELRSPITRAKVSVAMLEDEKPRTEIDHDLNEVERLIDELLESERLSSQHRILNNSTVNLVDLINELLKKEFDDQPIEMYFPDSDITLDVDAARIKLLIKNLLDNALRYNPTDERHVQLVINVTDKEVGIEVRDFGEGIDEHHLSHLMEPFYRVDPSRRRETGGYGLGLYLCRMIAEAHHGKLEIQSQKGQGTSVKVTLPRGTSSVFTTAK
jgi:signal transduction histidine kinase